MKSQKTIDREKERLCRIKTVGQICSCPYCNARKEIFFSIVTHEMDEHGDVQIFLIPKVACDEIYSICDACGHLNRNFLDLDKLDKMWYN
jgi:hypothetical protein